MDWHDWLLFLHVGSAFLLGMSFVAFWGAIVIGARPSGADPTRLALTLVRPATVLAGVGALGALAFGIWLAIDLEPYHPWDGWIIASLVLWLVATGAGNASGRAYRQAMDASPDAAALRRRGLLFHLAASAGYVAILVLMIFKPGA